MRYVLCFVIAFGSYINLALANDLDPATESGAADSMHPEVAGALAITDAWIEGLRAYRNIPGVSVGLVHDQKVVFSQGYGHSNLRRKRAADADTIYSICSISKLFTSIGVMQMRDADKLALRDPVADHLDWMNIKQAHSEAGPARISGLLTHSSGLPRESDFSYWTLPDHPFPDQAALRARLSEQDTLYPADSLFQYSNLGMALAGELVAQHAGQTYDAYIREAILDPLQMQDTRTTFPKELHGKQMAIGYAGRERDWKRRPLKPFDTGAIAPAAGFTSTVNDLAKFAMWHFRTLAGEQTVLAPNTLREMLRVHWVDPDWETTWGLGYVVDQADGQTIAGHGGGCPGYITSFIIIPKQKLAAIALTNAADGPAYNISQALLSKVGKAILKSTPKDGEVKEPPATDDLPDYSKYEGNYATGIWGGETAIRQWGKHLAAVEIPTDNLRKVAKLKHEEGDRFVRLTDDGEPRETWVFDMGEDGRARAFTAHSSESRRVE
ncbi:MAG: serine hydrolase [Pseudomonadota bacterium]